MGCPGPVSRCTWPAWLSRMLRWELRPGDPAAIFELPEGKISWLTVNDQEKIQVGHYHMLQRDWAEAWRWYEEAETGGSAETGNDDPRTMAQLSATEKDRISHRGRALRRLHPLLMQSTP